jgi:hypothetical protein
MAGTRTAPLLHDGTSDQTPNYKSLSISMIDYTGDQRTETIKVDAAATLTQLEAIVAALQAITNATVYKVIVGDVYSSVGSAANAGENVWENIQDNVVALYKDNQDNAFNSFVPAPEDSIFLEGTENVDLTNVPLSQYTAAIAAARSGFSLVSLRFSHRKQIGKRIKV